MADDQPMWGNNQAVAPTPEAAFIMVDFGDNFTVKGHHLSMIKDRQFDGRARADPHKHITEFIEICGMFRYGNTNVDSTKLKFFPSSLAGDAKVWYNESTPEVIAMWEQMREAFVSRFFPPAMFNRLEDAKNKPPKKTVSFVEGSNHSKLMKKMDTLTTKIESQLNGIIREIKEIQDGCTMCGGPHPSSKCDDKPMGGPEEEVNYAYGGYRGGGYRGNYYDRSSGNWRDHQPRDDNSYSQPCDDNNSTPATP
ncbi:reverse transcriptase domain-containing protein [Tanacetum coccineum]